jgi:hypothetical protein
MGLRAQPSQRLSRNPFALAVYSSGDSQTRKPSGLR